MSEQLRERAGRPRLAVAADGLTAGRVLVGVTLVAVIGVRDALAWGAALLALAWISDFADGRLARRAGGGTVLGHWDAIADAIVGLGVLVGLVIAGRVGTFPWLILGAVLVAGLLVTGNQALGMVAQAMAYGLFIVALAVDAPWALWMLGATAAVIGVADARRLTDFVLPTFFSGLGLSRRRPAGD